MGMLCQGAVTLGSLEVAEEAFVTRRSAAAQVDAGVWGDWG
jgi:hypothetical protein